MYIILKLGLLLPVATWARSKGEQQSRTKAKEKAKAGCAASLQRADGCYTYLRDAWASG